MFFEQILEYRNLLTLKINYFHTELELPSGYNFDFLSTERRGQIGGSCPKWRREENAEEAEVDEEAQIRSSGSEAVHRDHVGKDLRHCRRHN